MKTKAFAVMMTMMLAYGKKAGTKID